MVKLEITNIVASISLNTQIPLEKLAAELPNAEYNPEQFPGLILRLKEPKVTALIFRSGKVNITGLKSEKEIEDVLNKIIEILRKTGIEIKRENIEVKIQNIIAYGYLGYDVNLEEIAMELEDAEYDPEQFPGLTLKLPNSRLTFLVFKNGKIVCTGAKSFQELEEGVKKLDEILRKFKV